MFAIVSGKEPITHRLGPNAWAENLDELVPSFLPAVPRGVFDGQPLRYGKLPEGGRQIYSTGPNGRDEGGQGDDSVLKLPET